MELHSSTAHHHHNHPAQFHQYYDQHYNPLYVAPMTAHAVGFPMPSGLQSAGTSSSCASQSPNPPLPDSTTGYIVSANPGSENSAAESGVQDDKPRPRKRQRVNTNAKERRRNQAINSAFDCLQHLIPNLPESRKLSKIKTLRLTTKYIEYLRTVLAEDDARRQPANVSPAQPNVSPYLQSEPEVYTPPPTAVILQDFNRIVNEEVQTRNSYKARAQHELTNNTAGRSYISLWHQND